MTYKMAVSSVL